MENETGVVARWISPAQVVEEDLWDAAVFVRARHQFRSHFRKLNHLGAIAQRLFEGTRQTATSRMHELYRSSAISPFDLNPFPSQWSAAAESSPQAAVVGDVLVKRIAPIQAAVFSRGLPSLPVDANVFIVRGLSETRAWWVAYCLNHTPMGDYLVSKSGKTALRRLTLAVLSRWTPGEMPPGFPTIANELSALGHRRNTIRSQLVALQDEVDATAARQVPATGVPAVDDLLAHPSWWFIFPPAAIAASWIPSHVAWSYRSELVHHDLDWQPLAELLTPLQPRDTRFSQVSEPIPVLRLSDVGDIPTVPAQLGPILPTQPTRIFRDALEPDEVLLSTLGTSPRVVFAPGSTGKPVHPSDHWKRLRFCTHPAAYALLLQTTAVVRQLQSLTYGSTQEFIRPQDILRLFLPRLPSVTLARWDNALRSFVKSWNQVDAEWRAALARGWEVFQHQ